jgi:Glycosyltransferase family 87
MAKQATSAAGVALRSILTNRIFWICIAVWVVTRALMIIQVGFWNDVSGTNFQDADQYQLWSEQLAFLHTMPPEDTWQYPPGAAFVVLAPRLGVELLGLSYGVSFIVAMLLVDLVGLALMALLAKRTGRSVGVWVWLLAIPLLQAFPILRFDLVPTVLAIAALVVIHRRPTWFGALAGLGASIKVWPIVLLFGEWDRRRLAVSAATAAGAIALVFAVAAIAFGDQSTFLDNQNIRGLQVESVASAPWYVRQTITGKVPPTVQRDGTLEIGSDLADAVAVALKWLGLAVLAAAALWWLARDRAIRRGRIDLADAAVSRDFVFTIVLLLVVVSRVLSPQFMIWLIGLSAVVLTAGSTRLARPAWVVIGAVVLTAGLYQAPANMLIRNMALLVAALDAALAMFVVLRGTADKLATDGRADYVPAIERTPERQL